MHGFTVNQSYTTTYKTHYKSTTLHIDSAQNKEQIYLLKIMAKTKYSSPNQFYLIKNIPRDPTVSIPNL